jgi:hypothetical protein
MYLSTGVVIDDDVSSFKKEELAKRVTRLVPEHIVQN